jgi:hypothetical protein
MVTHKAFLGLGFAFAAGTAFLLPAPVAAGASARSFVCGSASGAPATNVVTADGRQVPVIRWTSSTFNDAGWNQQRRCQEVSARFDTFLKQGRLAYITTGRMNGLPVICTTDSRGGGCDGLLYTLKPGQDATATLKNLLDIRVKARGPLNETNERLYVSLNELLNTAHANASRGISAGSGMVQAQPANGLF